MEIGTRGLAGGQKLVTKEGGKCVVVDFALAVVLAVALSGCGGEVQCDVGRSVVVVVWAVYVSVSGCKSVTL